MDWEQHFHKLENEKKWDEAIDYMQQVITKNPNDVDAYLSINYLIMNLLVEEDYDETKYDYYVSTLKKYFDESYKNFSHNPKYLFYTSITGYMSEWYFNLELADLKQMMINAMKLEPNNNLYDWAYYGSLNLKDIDQKIKAIPFAKEISKENSEIKKTLLHEGAIGRYLFEIMDSWARTVLK